jgi:chromosomal replication initiator protein
MPSPQAVWQDVVAALPPEGSLWTWITDHPPEPIRLSFQGDGAVVLHLHAHRHVVSMLAQSEDPKWHEALRVAANTLGVPTLSVAFEVQADPLTPTVQEISDPLNEEMTFETFIVGDCNRYAHAAALAVADHPGRRENNPLVLWGSTGLGKTHLLTAIGHRLRARSGVRGVRYMTAEAFTNAYIHAVKSGTIQDFQRSYRQAGCLLVDDIHFLARGERTQEEFFNGFNELIQRGVQIVLTSEDRPERTKLDRRIVSRLLQGLVVDMLPPDMETYAAIVLQHAERMGLVLPEEAISMLGVGDFREAIGLVKQLALWLTLQPDVPLNLTLLRSLVPNLFRPPEDAPPTPSEVVQLVCRFFHVSAIELHGASKTKKFTEPRLVAYYLVRTRCGMSFPSIAAFFKRDAATVQYGVKRITQALETDPNLRLKIDLVQRELRQSNPRR